MQELNAWDRALLDKHLRFYRQLHSGERIPHTAAQAHFVQVCHSRLRPRTQHEIAYTRFLRSVAQQANRPHQTEDVIDAEVVKDATQSTTPSDQDPQPTEAALATVNQIDEALVQVQPTSRAARFLRSAKDLYLSGTSVAQSVRKDAALWLTMALSTPELAQSLSRWAGEQFNTLSNEVTKAMDGDFADGLQAGAEFTAPLLHRLFGGHTFPEAMAAARQVMPEASEAEIAWEAVRALASDMSSYAGLPLTTFSREGFAQATQVAERLGISQTALADMVTFNATELLAALVPAVALLLGWNKSDRAEFTKSLGAFSIAALASANPLLLVMVLIAGALDFHRNSRGRKIDQGAMAFAFAKGGALSGIVLTSSAVIAGPAWIGVVCGIVLALAAQRSISHTDFSELGRSLVECLSNLLPNPDKPSSPASIRLAGSV